MIRITCDEMRQMDKMTINTIGIPSIVLMENAAFKVIENIDLIKYNDFTIIAGVGNNGGDGLAIARQLIIRDKNIDLFIIGNINKATDDFKTNLHILKNMDIPFTLISAKKDLYTLKESLEKNHLTIDAILGLGLNGELEGLYFDVVSFTNLYSLFTVAVDTPSGLNCDTGNIPGIAIKADKTITFHLMKKGLLGNETYTGEVIVANIGIPEKVTNLILNK